MTLNNNQQLFLVVTKLAAVILVVLVTFLAFLFGVNSCAGVSHFCRIYT